MDHMYSKMDKIDGFYLVYSTSQINEFFRSANSGMTVYCGDCLKWFGSKHYFDCHKRSNQCIDHPERDEAAVLVEEGLVVEELDAPHRLHDGEGIHTEELQNAPLDPHVLADAFQDEFDEIVDASENGNAPLRVSYAEILDIGSMAPCVALHAKLIVDGRRMMQFLPPNQSTLVSICNYIREYLKKILEASTPVEFHQAWLGFFVSRMTFLN